MLDPLITLEVANIIIVFSKLDVLDVKLKLLFYVERI